MRTDEQGRTYVVVDPTVGINVAVMPNASNVTLTSISSEFVTFAQPVSVYTSSSGAMSVITTGNQTVSFNATAGGILPFSVLTINNSGTSATGIIAMW